MFSTPPSVSAALVVATPWRPEVSGYPVPIAWRLLTRVLKPEDPGADAGHAVTPHDARRPLYARSHVRRLGLGLGVAG